MKIIVFLIGLVPLAAVVIGLIFLYSHFIAPFGTTGLAFFILGGGLVIFVVLWKPIKIYFEFLDDLLS